MLREWHRNGGVMILGYDMFRNLTSHDAEEYNKEFYEILLNPGPDLLVCDEGHTLKNRKSSIFKAVEKVRTMRRILLSGTPLQNNLDEYFCMIQLVRPHLLGDYSEYSNQFVKPIKTGQFIDSSEKQIQQMRQRSMILHKKLECCVQRIDNMVLTNELKPLHEYTLYIPLTKLQIKLYKVCKPKIPNIALIKN